MTHDIVWTPVRLVDKTRKEMSGRREFSILSVASWVRGKERGWRCHPSILSSTVQLQKYKNMMGLEFWSYIYLEIKQWGDTMT